MTRKLFLFAILSCLAAALMAQDSDLPYFRVIDSNYAACGQPTQQGFQKVKELGYKTILNLRAEGEAGVNDERALVETLGMRYEWIPITADSITDEKVQKFAAIVDAPRNRPVFVHCASSNRVGALWAIYYGTKKGLPVEEALKKGADAGLKNPTLTETARRYIETHR